MQLICIVAMHRSGSSCLTGSLQEAGLFLGDVLTENPFNAKGNREMKRIMNLHNDILISNNGNWHQPPEFVDWNDQQRQIRDDILSDHADNHLWGFKDPRTLFTLNGWLDACPDLRLIGSFRHPKSVVKSLLARHTTGPLAEFDFMALWAKHNIKLIELYEQHKFPIINFDKVEQDYCTDLEIIANHLDLPGFVNGFDFFASDLRHHNLPDNKDLPDDINNIYQRLLEISI